MKPLKQTNNAGLELAFFQQDRNFDTPFVTFVVKGTFDITPGGACVQSKTQRPISNDVHYMDEIGRSLAWSSDLVPFKPHSDFLIHGSYHAPGGVPARHGQVWFEFGPLRKTLLIVGRRTAVQPRGQAAVVNEPEPIASLPLRWEYSAGAMRDRRNPLGLGGDPATGPHGEKVFVLPQIENPEHPIRALSDKPDPVNFAPIPRLFQFRLRKLGTRDQRWALFRAPLPPQDFDTSHYNAAPLDQQGGNYPRGDETLVLGNMHPTIPVLTTRLPGLAARLAVLRQRDGVVTAEAVPMHLDTVAAVPDENQVVLIWRGRCPVRDRKSDGELLWVATETEPVDGPSADPRLPVRLMRLWQAERDGETAAAAAAEAVAKERATKEAAHAAQTMASVKTLLGTAKFPPALTQVIATESDPEVLMKALQTFVDDTLAELGRRFPHLAGP